MNKKRFLNALMTWLAVLLPALIAAALYFFSGADKAFSTWYARNLYPVWVGMLGRINGWIPFSVNEIGSYLFLLLFIFFIVRDITRAVRKAVPRRWFSRWLRIVMVCVGAMSLVFMLGMGINYNRATFAEEYAMDLSGGTKEDLYYLSEIMTEEANALAEFVVRNEEGIMQLSGDVRSQAVSAMRELGEKYPTLSGFYPLPKPIWFSEFLSHEHITGIQSPYTSEAQYNRLITPYNLPHTICHELAHLKGYAREDEANFIGFLACIFSEETDMRYGGYVLGYLYASNALYGADYDLWAKVRGKLEDIISVDLAENSRYWAQYQTKLAEIKDKVNDAQLKFNHQEDGVKSYGRVVDLMLSFYRDEIEIRKASNVD
ncbi:MAG: DUF3810 domain-containing protein [Lachnospiraceae bacterium]|nr:DUF3810 domain-containing protein [Lachnospiraceae bacterium]